MKAFQFHGGQIQGARKRQEDAFEIESFADQAALAGVADGLGGHPAGDVASREGLKEFMRQFARQRSHGTVTPRHWLDDALHAAQRHLLKQQRGNSELAGMATTLVAAYVENTRLWAVSVGDSFLLRLRRGQLLLLNEQHGEGGGVTSAIGYNLSQIDLSCHVLEAGDRYLLASDGILTLGEREIARLLASSADGAGAVRALLAAVEKRTHPQQDNVTAVVLFT